MRAATVIAVALATFSSFPLTAQQQDTPATNQTQSAPAQQTSPGQQATPPAGTQTVQPSQSAQGAGSSAGAAAMQLQPVTGELVSNLDSKSAKQGDKVVLKTTEDVKTADGTDIPKGSKLEGTVTGVQARSEGKENSQIAIKFDRAELKGGKELPIQGVIESVASADQAGSTSATTMGGPSAGPSAGPGAGPTAGPATGAMPSSGGGNSNGMPNGSANNSAMTNHESASPSMTANGSGAQNGTGSTANSNMPAPGSIVARSGNVAIRMTSIPGVLLANNVNGQPFSNASGMLLGAKRDIHLDGGTQVVVAVATAPGGSAGAGMTR